ncbi:MAG: DEAD/DEAH box helicase [Egibacteraceae bacterium]
MTLSGSPPTVGRSGAALTLLDDFAAGYGFALDDFQVAGITALLAGRSALVAAPTGAGKTVVGEFAVWRALRQGGRCFYTTPIKALSNQKFFDLTARYGPDSVGLLTGDNVVNGDASVVVMTTEVLRNMLYEASPALRGLHAVVLDEVHYLADRERGAVWEEVIVQLPAAVQLACLSATVSNAEEFGAWLRAVRDGCDVVISEHRPVPLEHHYAVNDRIYPVFRRAREAGRRPDAQAADAALKARAGVPNPDVLMLERQAGTTNRISRSGRRQSSGVRLRPPRRSDLVRELQRRGWLPAITFIFSREGCDAAVSQLVRDGVRLTSGEEQALIRQLIDERTEDLEPDDLEVLGYGWWAAALERGIAAHHAGMVPVFKQAVEELFVRGLVKVCFATETLALGINMPARTVVIERLEKWSGQRHELLTPGQFTQLTGRAGRRGLDEVGHAVVVCQRDIDFRTVASLVGRRTEPLRSSFAPSYNMAVNLLRRHGRAEAEALLTRSFAQFQADAEVGAEAQRIARNRTALEGYAGRLVSSHGDFGEYWAIRRELSRLESAGARDRRQRRADAVAEAVEGLRPGDIVRLPGTGRRGHLAAVVSRTSSRTGTPLAGVVTDDRRLVRLGPREFADPPRAVGWVDLPKEGGPRQSAYRKAVASALHRVDASGAGQAVRPVRDEDGTRERIDELRAVLRAHPVHQDPDLSELEDWARCHDDLRAETERLKRDVRRRTSSIVRQFDRIVGVLTDLGYLDGTPTPTEHGLRLATLYAETDLVLAEALRRGILDDLDERALAAVASVFTYETRMKDVPEPLLPSAAVRRAVDAIIDLWADVTAREEAAGIPLTRPPDPGFADVLWRWAAGADLDEALWETQTTAGDFVRNTKQAADLCGQIREAMPGTAVAATARAASKAILRGVVAYTGL